MSVVRKRSKKRDAIYACICGTKSHPTAEWIHQQLKPQIADLSLGTVYRNLNVFREEGLIVSVGVINGLERFDANVSPHVHFVCETCGAVVDIDSIDVPTELALHAEATMHGKVTSCQLSFFGLCSDCTPYEKSQLS